MRCFIRIVNDTEYIRDCLDLTERLHGAGATVFAASHLDKALGLIDHPNWSVGVLDFDLGNAESTVICWRLVDRRIPFVFHPAASTARSDNGHRRLSS
jgi:hypothetical protein